MAAALLALALAAGGGACDTEDGAARLACLEARASAGDASAAELFHLGGLRRARGDAAGGAAAYEGALRARPGFAEALVNAGGCYAELGRHADAADALRAGLRARDWPPAVGATIHAAAGASLRALGRDADAEAALRAALALEPGHAGARAELRALSGAHDALARGAAAHAAGRHAEARLAYAAGLARDPSDAALHAGLGAALHALGELEGARAALREARRLEPGMHLAAESLGIVERARADCGGAAEAWEAAAALAPAGDAAAAARAGHALLALGRYAAARDAFGAAARAEPSSWHHAYAAALAALHARDARGALGALARLHRTPIPLERAAAGERPPWMARGGRGLPRRAADALAARSRAELREAAAASAELAARGGPVSGVIVYKLGPAPKEVTNLHTSLALLRCFVLRRWAYPVLVAHDGLPRETRRALGAELGPPPPPPPPPSWAGARFVRVRHSLPPWLSPEAVPRSVGGFSLEYRHAIRWRARAMFRLRALRHFEYYWMLDTDSFILAPLRYDPLALLRAANASYGYMDVHPELSALGDGLFEVVREHLDAEGVRPTMLHRFVRAPPGAAAPPPRPGGSGLPPGAEWDRSKFYCNWELGRLDFWRSAAYERLFGAIDRAGGIYTRRWGRDPISFMGVTSLLGEAAVRHFADVSFLHQHLVANLPRADEAGGNASAAALRAADRADELTLGACFAQPGGSPPPPAADACGAARPPREAAGAEAEGGHNADAPPAGGGAASSSQLQFHPAHEHDSHEAHDVCDASELAEATAAGQLMATGDDGDEVDDEVDDEIDDDDH